MCHVYSVKRSKIMSKEEHGMVMHGDAEVFTRRIQ
jgi:hypothetical protein